MSDLLTHYLDCWNETDPVSRRALLRRHWTEDASYCDPVVAVRGLDELDATIAAVQDRFPGLVFSAGGEVDAHHDQARFTWHLGPAGGEAVVVGSDVVVTDGDGRFTMVLGFLDRVPS